MGGKCPNLLWLCPIAYWLCTFVGFFVTYGIARAHNTTLELPDWPTVSATGDKCPSSCWFTLFLMWAFVSALISMYAFYKYVETKIKQEGIEDSNCCCDCKLNKAAFVVGIIACIGMTFVGSMQVSAIANLHYVGAGVAFVFVTVYFLMVVIIDWRLPRDDNCYRFRYILFPVEFVAFLTFFGSLFKDIKNGVEHNNVTTIAEWVMIMGASFLALTLSCDLYKIKKLKSEARLIDAESGRSNTYKNDGAATTNC